MELGPRKIRVRKVAARVKMLADRLGPSDRYRESAITTLLRIKRNCRAATKSTHFTNYKQYTFTGVTNSTHATMFEASTQLWAQKKYTKNVYCVLSLQPPF